MEDIFFGRTEYLDILQKRISDLKDGYRQNIAFIGDELVGKTSIIFRFLNKFCDNRIIILYLEIRPESLDTFARRFIGVLLYNFLAKSDIPLKEDIDFLIDKSERFIPKTIAKIKLILCALSKKKRNDIFAELLLLSDSIYQETGKSCVIIMDEFLHLEQIGVKNLYKEWSRILILQKNTMYILISSMKFKARYVLSKSLSLLFGNFEIITVEPFDIKTSEEYLDYRLKEMSLNKGLRDFIVNFTGGYPFYLSVISDALLKSTGANLVDTLENLLFDASGILNQRFSNYLKRFLDSPNSQDYISIIYLISKGNNKLKDISHILRKPQKELNIKINQLVELDALTRSGDFLKINDRVFSFWLKFVYQEKLNSLTFDAQNQKSVFRDKIEGMIQEFLFNSQKPIPDRVMELLRMFADETIQIERKKFRLAHFREIKPLEFNSRSLKNGMIGRSSDSLWILAFKYDLVTEEDIIDFVKECKKYRYKLQRKIILAFNDVDTNARLRAMDEKIWTWDINNLNNILDLYYKPRVII